MLDHHETGRGVTREVPPHSSFIRFTHPFLGGVHSCDMTQATFFRGKIDDEITKNAWNGQTQIENGNQGMVSKKRFILLEIKLIHDKIVHFNLKNSV